MRASRLLQMLLLLQNRGRMTSGDLARALEVTQRTILRDVDALTEAGLPMVAHAGYRGGIELGFDYRTRLAGLADGGGQDLGDPRLPALARAVRERRVVRIHALETRERVIHPVRLVCDESGWTVHDDLAPDAPIPLDGCGDLNLSAATFTLMPRPRRRGARRPGAVR